MTTIEVKQKIQIVTIAEKQLLLLQFANLYQGGFQNITGSVESGENFYQAAHRELTEEIGIDADIIDLKHEFHFHSNRGNDVHEKTFLCLLEKKPEIRISDEHQSYKWIAVDNIVPADFVFPSNYEAFKRAMEYAQK